MQNFSVTILKIIDFRFHFSLKVVSRRLQGKLQAARSSQRGPGHWISSCLLELKHAFSFVCAAQGTQGALRL